MTAPPSIPGLLNVNVTSSGFGSGSVTVPATTIDSGNIYFIVIELWVSGIPVPVHMSHHPLKIPIVPPAAPVVTAVNLPPAFGAPSGFTLIEWTPIPSATHYNIYRSTSSSGPFTLVLDFLPIPDFGEIIPNTPIYYMVRAVNSLGQESSNSNVVLAIRTP